MTTTEDTESLVNRIIAELEARPEVKPALLRALLTDEFLLLPAKVDRLMELMSHRGKAATGDVSELKDGTGHGWKKGRTGWKRDRVD